MRDRLTNEFVWQHHQWNLKFILKLQLAMLVGCSILWNSSNTAIEAQVPSSTAPTADTANLSAEEHFKRGNLTRAIQLWGRDIKNGTEVAKSLYNRSQAYIVLRQYESALQDLNQLIKIQGVNTPVQVYVLRGIAYNELNKLTEAIEDFNQAEKLEPSLLVYTNRGLAYQRSQQFDKALEDFNRSVKLSPTPISKLNLANVRIQLGQFKEVINEMSELIDKEKGFFPAYLVRSIAYYNLGQYESAIKDCLFSLKILPDQPEAYYYAGLSFAKLNRKDDASQNLVRAADLYLRQNQSSNYRQVLEKMSELNLQ